MNRRSALVASAAAALVLGGCANLGVHPFPKDIEPGHGMQTGVDLFPDEPMNPRPVKTMGLTAFPEPRKDDGRRIGLDPFPLGKKTAKAGCAAGCTMACCAPAAPAPTTISVEPKAGAAVPAAIVAPVAPTLSFKFKQGESRAYRMNMDTIMKSPMFGEEGMVVKMGMNMNQTVSRVRDDGAGVVLTAIKGMSMEMSNPMMGTFKMDTADEASMKEAESNPMLGQLVPALKMIVGKQVEITMDSTGRVLEMGGFEELAAGMGGMGGANAAQMTGLPSTLPAGPVHEGMTWPFESSQDSPMGAMTTKGTMKVTALDMAAGTAVISLEGITTQAPPDEEADPDDMAAQMAAMMTIKDAKMTGELLFDFKGGFMRKSTTSANMIVDNPMMGGEMTMEATVVLAVVE